MSQVEQGPWVIVFNDSKDVAQFGGVKLIHQFDARELAEHFNETFRLSGTQVVTLAEALRLQGEQGKEE